MMYEQPQGGLADFESEDNRSPERDLEPLIDEYKEREEEPGMKFYVKELSEIDLLVKEGKAEEALEQTEKLPFDLKKRIKEIIEK